MMKIKYAHLLITKYYNVEIVMICPYKLSLEHLNTNIEELSMIVYHQRIGA